MEISDLLLHSLYFGILIIFIFKFFELYQKVQKLEKEKQNFQQIPVAKPSEKQDIVFLDGCFDMSHYGHFNAIRQASKLGKCVLGLNYDEEIIALKGKPIYNYEERKIMMSSLRFVEKIEDRVPYTLTPEYLKYLFDEVKIDFVLHGDDPCFDADGNDVYQLVKSQNKMKIIKRTEGISTTDIIGRILMATDPNYKPPDLEIRQQIKMLPTLWRYIEFSGGERKPKPNDKIVLITGSFDVLHPGHVAALEVAKSMGDFLYVGIHDDQTVREKMGPGYPIMNVHERSLSLLAIKYVDDVIMGCPWVITKDIITSLHISLVVHGTNSEPPKPEVANAPQYQNEFKVPKQLGIFQEFTSPSNFTVHTIIDRVSDQRANYVKKYERKLSGEIKYYESDSHVAEV